MIEFDVDMGYLLEYDKLDKVVLNDENGEHEPMEFVPKDAATVGVGTCQIETTESWLPAERYHRCKHCGAFFAVLDASSDIPPRACPNCGRRITKED